MTIRRAEAKDAPWVRQLLIDFFTALGNEHAEEVQESDVVQRLTALEGIEYESWVDDELHLWCHCEYEPDSKRGVPAIGVSNWLPGKEGSLGRVAELDQILSVTLLTLLRRLPNGEGMMIYSRFEDESSRDAVVARFGMTIDANDSKLATFTTTPGWPQLSERVRVGRDSGRISRELSRDLLQRQR